MKLTLNQMKKLVIQKYSLVKALNKLFTDRYYQAGQTCYCPFHDNTDTPAAAIYDDEKGESLYCFTERKLYTVIDVIDKFMHKDVYQLAENIWLKMSDEEQALWLQENEDHTITAADFDEEEEPVEDKKLEKAKQLYKAGKSSLKELLTAYIK